LSGNYSFAVNQSAKGVVKITGYGVLPLEGAGELIRLKFRARKRAAAVKTFVGWNFARLNEGEIPVVATGATIAVSR
jgi:hypothetical protein